MMIDAFVHLRKSMRTVMVVLELVCFNGMHGIHRHLLKGPKLTLASLFRPLIPKGYENSVSLADSLEKRYPGSR